MVPHYPSKLISFFFFFSFLSRIQQLKSTYTFFSTYTSFFCNIFTFLFALISAKKTVFQASNKCKYQMNNEKVDVRK